MYKHTGPARIFESQEAACEGLLQGEVKPGDVAVIRNEGPRGGPGMQEMLAPTSYLRGAGLADKCYLITDGRFSGGTAGPCIGYVSPETAAGGEIGLLKDGDVIEIDALKQTINARVSAAEFARRAKAAKPFKPRITTGWLARYTALATSADTGAVLTNGLSAAKPARSAKKKASSAGKKAAKPARKQPAKKAARKRPAAKKRTAKKPADKVRRTARRK
jgi:dihydroxy-acid dehydratase